MRTQRNLKARDRGRYSTGPNDTLFSIGNSSQCYVKFDTSDVLATKRSTRGVMFFDGHGLLNSVVIDH